MFCSDCGQQNADDAKFCQKCGKKFVAVETLSSQSPEPEKPSTPASQDSVQPRSFVDTNTHVSTELKDSGTVTAMSVVGFVFGLIGMLGSFIPCIGSLAFFIGIPAALISAIALGIAYSQNAKKTFAIVAVTISLIGVVISGWQYFSIISAGENARKETEKMLNQGQQRNQSSNEGNGMEEDVKRKALYAQQQALEEAMRREQVKLEQLRIQAQVPTVTLGTYKCYDRFSSYGTAEALGEAILTDVDASYVHVYPNEEPYKVKVVFEFSNINNISKEGRNAVHFDLKREIWSRPGDRIWTIGFAISDQTTRDRFYNDIVEAKRSWDRKYPKLQ